MSKSKYSKKLLIIVLAIIIIFGFFGTSIWLGKQKTTSKSQSFTHSADYSQLIGELIYSELEGGFWQIRYGEVNDRYGGKFVLGNEPRLANFKNGILVKITGYISEKQVSSYQAGTLYTIESIELLK